MSQEFIKTQISAEEYARLVLEQVREIRLNAREEHKAIDLQEAIRQARQIVSDFYTKETR